MDLAGRTLAHYRIIDEISRGGMGVVYRALDTRLNREVALKVLPEDLVNDPDRRRRFLQEAQAASALEHPHIGVIHAVDEVEGVTFIAMELIRGEKLSDTLARLRPTAARALEIAAEIAAGLARAHEKHIVHRDLKPANVMITDEGHAKIIDFGIAKLIESAAEAGAETIVGRDTGVGVVLGTMTYMSPEQTRGDKVDHRSDIFSFGIVLHEMLAGRPPFQGKTGVETGSAILHEPAPRLPPLGPNVAVDAGADIQRIVDKCLAKDPDDRYQGMKDIVVDLRTARRHLESTSQAVPAAAVRVRPRWMWGTVAAAVAIVGAVGLLLWRASAPSSSGVVGLPPASTKPSVAVLYFDNTTGNANLDWMRTGITDMVVTDLSQGQDLEVISTDVLYQVLADLNRADDKVMSPDVVREVAARTGVTSVLVGSYMKAGDAIRINVRLQDVKTGRIVTSERVEGPNEASLFSMVDDLSRRLRSKFQSMTGGAASVGTLLSRPGAEAPLSFDRALGDVTTGSIEAYRHYAEGNSFHERNREAEAAAALKKAVEIDPGFAMAYVKLSVANNNLGYFAERDKYAKLALDRTDRVTPRERFYIQGYAYSLRPATLAQSMDAYQSCLALDASHMSCRHNLALQYAILERFAESIQHGEELRRRGTSIPTTFANLAASYIRLGQMDKARAVVDDLVRRSPEVAVAYEALGDVSIAEGRPDDAIVNLTKAAQLDPRDADIPFARGMAEALAERWDLAEKSAAAMATSADPTQKWLGALLQSRLLLFMGRSGDALRWTERAAQAYQTPGPRSATAHVLGANILLARSQAPQALSRAEQARRDVLNQGGENGALIAVAAAQAALGRRADAESTIATLERKVEKLAGDRDVGRVHFARGVAALAAGDSATAVRELGPAAALLSARGGVRGGNSHMGTWFMLAQAHMAAGQNAEAVRWFQRVAESGHERFNAPIEYVRSFYFLGQLHEKQGDAVKAREAYRRFVGYWKDGDLDRERVAEAIRKLGTT